MNILITGDSHCSGYQDAASAIASSSTDSPDVFDVRPIGRSNALHRPFHDVHLSHVTFKHEIFYVEEFARGLPRLPLAGRDGPFHWYGFSGPFQVFDLFLDKGLYDDRRTVASQGLLRKLVEARCRAWMRFLADARTIGLPCFVIESPLPFATSPMAVRVVELANWESLLANDRAARGFVKQALRNLDVVVVELPERAITPHGFMDEQYRHPDPHDPHHGNLSFSMLMLSRAASALRAIGRFPGHGQPPQPAFATSEEPAIAFTPTQDRQVLSLASLPDGEFSFPVGMDAKRVEGDDGYSWLEIRSEPAARGAARFKVPQSFSARIPGRQIRVSVLARSASPDRGTRFALSFSGSPDEDVVWHWFWADRPPSGGYFEHVVPFGQDSAETFISFKGNDSPGEMTAATELSAIGVEILG